MLRLVIKVMIPCVLEEMCNFLNHLSNYQLLRMDSASRCWFQVNILEVGKCCCCCWCCCCCCCFPVAIYRLWDSLICACIMDLKVGFCYCRSEWGYVRSITWSPHAESNLSLGHSFQFSVPYWTLLLLSNTVTKGGCLCSSKIYRTVRNSAQLLYERLEERVYI
jgi:hypothetical protein